VALEGSLPVYLIHYRASAWCGQSIASIEQSTVPTHVTVIDNGGLGPCNARVLTMPRNSGYTGAANRAVRDWLDTDAPFAVIASHDLIVEPTTFERLLAATDEHTGIIGPAFDTRVGGAEITRADAFLETAWVSGGCMLLRRECIEQIGGQHAYDERFGSYVEDVDVSYRARDAGWRVGIALDAPARALGSATPPPTRKVLMETNWILLHVKRHEWAKAVRRWLWQPVHAVRHPTIAARFLKVFVLVPWKLAPGRFKRAPR
jgi:GT2 family glycosyltransferase